MSVYYNHGGNMTRGRSTLEKRTAASPTGPLDDFRNASRRYQKTAFLAGFPSEYIDDPNMIASKGFGNAMSEFRQRTLNKGHGVFYVASKFMNLKNAAAKLSLFFFAAKFVALPGSV
ncbi:uncharacterized protein LOC144168559 [Haemaphysalis longicornis]